MTLKTKRLIDISLAFALAFCIILSMSGFSSACEDMYRNIVRIRIIANSDSAEDQNVKLAVRDAVLASSNTLFSDTKSCDDALCVAKENLDYITAVALNTLRQNGYNYEVSARVGSEFFDTRVYDNFTLPAGTYETLVLTLGEGKGENWWCVMFPTVCVGAAAGELTDSIKDSSAEYALNSSKYVLKFKAVEIFEKIKKII